jgi:hypothetical protein
MQQTLGAFLAIRAVMTFSLNYHRATLQSQQTAINSEMEVMANAVASDVMNYVASKSFDARTADNSVDCYNRNTDLLTSQSAFGMAVFDAPGGFSAVDLPVRVGNEQQHQCGVRLSGPGCVGLHASQRCGM